MLLLRYDILTALAIFKNVASSCPLSMQIAKGFSKLKPTRVSPYIYLNDQTSQISTRH